MIDQFVSDLSFEDQRYAVLVRTPVSSGIIAAIQLPPLPEGYAFYSAAQLPARYAISIFDCDLPVLANREPAYQGQAVGILTGTDMAVLEALRNDTIVTVEPNPEDSFEAEHTHTLFDYPIIAKETYSVGDVDACFEAAPVTVYSSLKTASQYTARSEPFSAIAVYREDGLDVYVPTQWPLHVRAAVAEATGLAENAIVVHPAKTGETANELLWYPSLLAAQCAVAAVLEKKTVVLILSAAESRAAAPKTPEMIIEHKSVVSDNKTIEAMQISIIVNAGACCPLIGKILKQMIASALGPYHIPNYRIEVRAAKTPQGLIDIFEGWGDYYTSNALENHISKLIQEHNLAPVDWRLATFQKDYSGVFTNILKTITAKSDFGCKYAAYHLFNSGKRDKHDGRWRGIGIAAGFQYSGCPADFTYSVEIELNVHNQLVIKAEPAAEDLKKIIRAMAAEKLDIPAENVVFAGLTTADMNSCGPATAGVTVSVLMPLVQQCLNDLLDQRFRNPLPLTITRSYHLPQQDSTMQGSSADVSDVSGAPFCTAGDKAISISEKNTAAFVSQTPAVCVVELELDTVCYAVMIRGIWFSCSPGKVYDTKRVLSYLHKNAAAALSRICTITQLQAENADVDQYGTGDSVCLSDETAANSVADEAVYSTEDEKGIPIQAEGEQSAETIESSRRYSEYRIILPNELPPLSVEVLERDAPLSAFASCAENILPAAYLAALNQILLRVPMRIDSLPILTEDIFKALRGGK
ncbi:MAG: molybdopterin cofactor-binding domain-containing protein [Treponema sp.]|uniref:molybdopterin cofactor-binding domain-containing protein n=1 Tax=Treponema sp. TaxID=166 RepID=UPI003FA22866